MVNRAISSGNRFAYCSQRLNDNGNGYQPYEKDVIGLIKIEECQFLPDRRCLLQGVVEKRIRVRSSWVERGTQGLWFVNFDEYLDHDHCDKDCGVDTVNLINEFLAEVGDDGDANVEDRSVSSRQLVAAEHLEMIQKFENWVYRQSNRVIQGIEGECGDRVTLSEHNLEKWSFWVCSLIWTIMDHQAVS